MNVAKSNRHWRQARAIVVVAVAAFVLAACADARRTLGLGKQSPNEFTVVRKAPLSMPPDFNLRPPAPGAVQAEATDTRAAARAALRAAGNSAAPAATTVARSPGEQSLLRSAGVAQSDDNIRDVLRDESTQLAERDDEFINRLIFWRRGSEDSVVDPTEVSRRVVGSQLTREATPSQPAGARPTAVQEAPTIRRRRRFVIGDIF
jgi:predicted small secreted protein